MFEEAAEELACNGRLGGMDEAGDIEEDGGWCECFGMGRSVGKVAWSLLLEQRLVHCNVLAVDGHDDRWMTKGENRSVDL